MNTGVIYALLAYVAWGIVPLYWKSLHDVPPIEILAHRIVWSSITLGIILAFRGELPKLVATLRIRKNQKSCVLSGVLIALNWLLFIYGVNSGQMVETSLGYFICPLITILLGGVIFGEYLRPLQRVAVVLAAIGVLNLAVGLGSFPWLAVVLALTFALYGAVKKASPVDALLGLTIETLLLVIPSLIYLLYKWKIETGAFLTSSFSISGLLALSGLVTSLPLLCYGAAARRIPLTLLGFLHYLSPGLQLVIGIFVYHEAFTQTHLVSYSLTWAAVVLALVDLGLRKRGALPLKA